MAGTRKTAVAVVLAALALTATACDKNDKSAAPAAPTTAAAGSAAPSTAAPAAGAKPEKVSPAVFLEQVTQKTGAAKSAKVEEVIKVGDAVTMTGQGAVSWADGLEADLTMDLSGSPMGKLVTPITGGPKAHYLYTKEAAFLALGGELLQSGGPRWVRYSTADMAKASGGATDQLQSADPVQGVRTLIAGGKVAEVGPETVNGKATTHYSGVLTTADLGKAATQGITQAQADRLKASLDAAGISSEQVDVWVDADKLVVKRTEQAESKAGPVNVTVSYADYGTPVIAATPVDSIDVADLQKAVDGS
ncbi:hypothetical protein ACWD4P_19090 [Kitasatospora sp. NPDC002543]